MGKKTAKSKMYAPTAHGMGQQRHIAALGLSDAPAYRAWCRANGFGTNARKNWRQRRQELRHAAKLSVRAEASCVMERHVRDLNVGTVSEYKLWCRLHGFVITLHKGAAQREQEMQTAQRERLDALLHASAQAARNIASAEKRPQAWIRAIFAGQADEAQLPSAFLKRLYAFVRAEKNRDTRRTFEYLLLTVSGTARELLNVDDLPCPGAQIGMTYLHGLLALARRGDEWQRDLADWKPARWKVRRLFASLARHLLARYPVPAFMDRAWFEGGAQGAQQQRWFLHVASGGNLRAVDTPIPLTKRASHYVLRAPADFTFEAALRWGQVRGMGGTERLARAVAASLLPFARKDGTFWNGVIHWFVNHPELETHHVGPIVDFIHNVKYARQHIVRADGSTECIAPPEPGFDMKGRTPAALLRRVAKWHQEIARLHQEIARRSHQQRKWPHLDVGELQLQQDTKPGGVFYWTIQQLLNSRELEEEGRAMRNCVASYISNCERGKSSIWSLRVMAPDAPRAQRVMTIEVDPAGRQIVQARGKCNVLPASFNSTGRLRLAPTLLRRWADQQGLSFGPYAL